MKYTLRDYQQESVDKAMEWCRTNTTPALLELATGAGKSLICADLARQFYNKSNGKRVLCLQPSAELTEQNYSKYLLTGEQASIYSASISKSLRHPVIYATPLSFKSVAKAMGDKFTAVIVDEAHNLTPTIREIISDMREGNPNLRVIGMTATPYRLGDGYIYAMDHNNRAESEAVEPYFKKLLHRVTAPYLIDEGFLTPPMIGAPEKNYDTTTLKASGNSYTSQSLESTFNSDKRLTHDIIQDVLLHTQDKHGVMIFGASIKHCEEIMKSLPSDNSAMITGKTKKKDREYIISEFKAGRIKYLVNRDVLTVGFDDPHVDCIVILRATESASLFSQIIGRGLRLHPGKEYCLILDYAENIPNLFPDGDIFNPAIKSRIHTAGEPIQVLCPDCGSTNDVSYRSNKQYDNYNEFGYYTDLAGNVTEEPAHYGRRCTSMTQVAPNQWERCAYWWTHKECDECGHKNDIAARFCESCKLELVDPNDKLKLEFTKLKRDPRIPQTDEVISMNSRISLSKGGNEMYRVDYVLKNRKFTTYYMIDTGSAWLKKKTQEFEEVTMSGTTAPRTITYKKTKSDMWEIIDYNLKTDEERYNEQLEAAGA